MNIVAEEILKTITILTDEIGVRPAGSEAEKKAAEYLLKRFRQYTPYCRIEKFPVLERVVWKEKLQIRINGKWQQFPCSLYMGAGFTGGREITAELVFFDGHTEYQRPDLEHLRGKAVIHYGAHPGSEDNYRRLLEAGPAFLLMVDTRHPGRYPLADGLFPKLVEKYGSIPFLSVAFYDVWSWMTCKADAAKLIVKGENRPSFSQNVIAEIPGEDIECVYLGAHHDTQAGSPGADDNAVGCAILVELCRELSQRKHRHTIRLICFGAEEQLSQGSAAYVRSHHAEMRKGRFMCNFDSCGTAVGWNYFIVNAGRGLSERIRRHFNARGIYYQEYSEPEVFTDQFPFAAVGIPGMTLERGCSDTGLFYHHRFDNTPDKISAGIVAELAGTSGEMVELLADRPQLAALCSIPSGKQKKLEDLWNDIFN
ncbi:MAG: Zn-dependent exopeptidase M28 [Lentisphaeria bacterium]|nr:Zn-dependent exopeptidase M28 [Lentisphaeria bacterium]